MPGTSQPVVFEPPLDHESIDRIDGKPLSARVNKRIVVCCDGTWQDGIVAKHRWEYSNIVKLSRMINHQDDRQSPPSPQIVFYQAGVGSEQNIYAEYIEGTTGASLAEKVQEAYGFIAHNYQPGDEIYLFGFSRGAYTARMTASFIGEIGILDRVDMDNFADIFLAYQGGANLSEEQKIEYENKLKKFTDPKAKGRLRADIDGDTFTVQCLGVFDTVGSVGLPEEFTFSRRTKDILGFSDTFLGPHIQRAFHAIAIHETRASFDVNKFEQKEEGRRKGQVLKQVWFSGCHSDVGGGYQSHDLADVSLAWMASNIESLLSLNLDYLRSIPRPIAPWGAQTPHNPRTGIFQLSQKLLRSLPTETTENTQEYIHPSVLCQQVRSDQLMATIKANPKLLTTLSPVEEKFRSWWPYIPGENEAHGLERERQDEKQSVLRVIGERIGMKEVMEDEGGRPRYQYTWIGSLVEKIPIVG